MRSIFQKKGTFETSGIGRELKESKKYKITQIAKSLGLSRSTFYLKGSERPMFYSKRDDDAVLSEINEILKIRSTYGYKRITAMMNKARSKNELKPYNRKRILRVMQMNGLVYPKVISQRQHTSTGKVMTLHSNTRWCSDCFEIKCFNGEKVFVIFVLDACDR